MQRICVFCGSSTGNDAAYGEAAGTVGAALARRGLGLVYGGGRVGLMGLVADAALGAGATAIGVIPQALAAKEIAHAGLTELHVVGSMHERKALMADLADGFIALPGGFGTWEELCEIVTWAQLGYHRKPCALLNVAGYYDPLLALVERAVTTGFLRPEYRDLVLVDDEIERLLDRMGDYRPPAFVKWVDRDET
jgi:uncharacterized protein (TIGR00730 family)